MFKKTRWFVTLIAVLALVAAACGSDDDAGGGDGDTTTTTAAPTTTVAPPAGLPDLGGRTVTVGVENAYFPFNFVDDDGDGAGWDYDAWNAICAALNCVPEYVESVWPGVIDQVAQGELDTAADGISITDERKQIVDFSDPYLVVQQRLVVRLDDDRYATTDDVINDSDATIGTQQGTTNYDLAVDLVGVDRIDGYDQFPLAIEALLAGSVDAVIIDDSAGLGYIGVNSESLTTVEGGLQSDPLGFIYPQGSDLVDPVNQALAALKADGTMEQIALTWFSPEEEEPVALPDLGGRTVTVGVENAYFPFNFVDDDGDGAGWDYDAWNAICAALNCVPEYVESVWPGVIDQVAQGELDTAADGISITDERKQIVDFSDPYLVVQQRLVVRLDDDRYATTDDVINDSDATIGTQQGTTNYDLAVDLVGVDRIDGYDQFPLAIEALLAGSVDAVIIDDSAGLGYIGVNSESLTTVEGGLQSDPLGFIYPQGSDLVDPVNQALAALKADGTMEQIALTWFSPEE